MFSPTLSVPVKHVHDSANGRVAAPTARAGWSLQMTDARSTISAVWGASTVVVDAGAAVDVGVNDVVVVVGTLVTTEVVVPAPSPSGSSPPEHPNAANARATAHRNPARTVMQAPQRFVNLSIQRRCPIHGRGPDNRCPNSTKAAPRLQDSTPAMGSEDEGERARAARAVSRESQLWAGDISGFVVPIEGLAARTGLSPDDSGFLPRPEACDLVGENAGMESPLAEYALPHEGQAHTFTRTAGGFVDTLTGSRWDISCTAVEGSLRAARPKAIELVHTFWFGWAASAFSTAVLP